MDYETIIGVSQELVSQLLDESRNELFKTHGEVGYQGRQQKNIRIQIENFLKSSSYCTEITFYKVMDKYNNPVKILFTKDDFRGYFIIFFSRIKSFSQTDVDEYFYLTDGWDIDVFRIEEYYSEELIKELIDQGIPVDRRELMAITRNYGEKRIIWLGIGNGQREFIHIIDRHAEDFEEHFGITEYRDIAKFIFHTISKTQIYNSFEGYSPGSVEYIYRLGRNYLHVVVDVDGFIVTAYPSYYGN